MHLQGCSECQLALELQGRLDGELRSLATVADASSTQWHVPKVLPTRLVETKPSWPARRAMSVLVGSLAVLTLALLPQHRPLERDLSDVKSASTNRLESGEAPSPKDETGVGETGNASTLPPTSTLPRVSTTSSDFIAVVDVSNEAVTFVELFPIVYAGR